MNFKNRKQINPTQRTEIPDHEISNPHAVMHRPFPIPQDASPVLEYMFLFESSVTELRKQEEKFVDKQFGSGLT